MSVERPSYGMLKRVQIEKMWGEKNIDINFEPINLFVGVNGSGKTTFIKIIEAVASLDIESMTLLNFKSCVIYIDNGYIIECHKYIDEDDPDIIRYIIKNENKVRIDTHIDLSIIRSKYSRDSYRYSYDRYVRFKNSEIFCICINI